MLRDTELAGLARTLGKDTDLTITVGGDNSYCSSDGSRINIARMPATPLGRMLMTGLVFHEISHKKHTQGNRPAGLLGELTNIIEDVRVEALTIQERPGTRYDLEAVTTHYAQNGGLVPSDTTTALLGLVLAYGYGEILHHHAVKELLTTCQAMLEAALDAAFVTDVLQLLKQEFPVLVSTLDAQTLAQRIIDRLKQVPEEEKSSPEQADQNSKDDTEAGSSLEGQQPQQQKSEPPPGDSAGDDSSSGGQQQESNPSSDECSRSDSSAERSQAIPAPSKPTEQEINQIISASSGGYGDRSSALLNDLNQLAADTPQEERHAVPLLPASERVTKPDRYAEIFDAAAAIATSSRLRARLLVLMQARKRLFVSAGLNGRRIDTRQLVRIGLGNPKIFEKKEDSKAVNTAVVVLIDGSGSMLATGKDGKTLSEVANSAAFALHTALYHLAGMKVASAVFAGRGAPEVRLLANFGEKPNASLFQVRPAGGTPTDIGIWYARAVLLGRPEPRKLVLIVTDGHPDDLTATRAATQRIGADGVEISAIGIHTGAVQQIWEQHCVIGQVQELPNTLFKMMEEMLLTRREGRS